MVGALSGVKVIDLTRILSGPFCTMLLGDMGADVIKIEPPGIGDPIRTSGHINDGLSWYFAAFNRNKRSVILDLRTERGHELLAKLLEDADVLVENFRPGVLAEMGFDEAHLSRINPRLVVSSINGYGASGPYSKRPAFDFVIQAMSGFMGLNGEPDGEGVRSAAPITDLVAGLYCAFGIVNALRARDLTDRGQRVETAMMDSIVSMFAYLASEYLSSQEEPVRSGNNHPIASPYGLFEASDGAIAVAPSTDPILSRFLGHLGLASLLTDPRFITNDDRVRNRPLLNELINTRTRERSQKYWVEQLNAAGVPCGVVQRMSDVLCDPQIEHQNMVIEVSHPGHGNVKMLGFPIKLSGTPCTIYRPAPRHGEHTQEVLADLNCLEYPDG